MLLLLNVLAIWEYLTQTCQRRMQRWPVQHGYAELQFFLKNGSHWLDLTEWWKQQETILTTDLFDNIKWLNYITKHQTKTAIWESEKKCWIKWHGHKNEHLYIAGADAGAGKGGDGLGYAAGVLQHMDDRGQVTLVGPRHQCWPA